MSEPSNDSSTRLPQAVPESLQPAVREAIALALKSISGTTGLETAPLDLEALSKRTVALSGVVGFSSHSLKGALGIQLPRETFQGLFANLLKDHPPEKVMETFIQEVIDRASPQIETPGDPLQVALSTILIGKSLESLGNPQAHSRLGLELRTPAGPFWALVEIHPQGRESKDSGSPLNSPKHWTPVALLEFVKAVRKTLEVQFSTPIEIGTPFRKSGEPFTFDVGSMIGVVDGPFSGYFGMFYEKATFLGLMSSLLGSEFSDLNAEIEDGASEITNICFGVAKQVLNEQGHAIQMALPYLVRGKGITSASSSDHRVAIAVPLTTPKGRFWIEFGYRGQ